MATFAEHRSKTTAGSHSETRLSRHHARSLRGVCLCACREGRQGRTVMASAGGGTSSGRGCLQRTTAYLLKVRGPPGLHPPPIAAEATAAAAEAQSKRSRDDLAGAILGPLPAGASSGEVRWNWARGYHQIVRPRPPIACDLFLRALPPALTVACRRLVAVSGRSTSIETPTRFTAGWTR